MAARAQRGEAGPAPASRFYGLDLYSLHASVEAVLAYLAKIDPEGAARARERYACLDHSSNDYGYSVALGVDPSCEAEVIAQLVELRRRAAEYAKRDGRIAPDEHWVAEQNAFVVKNAEAYYRTMYAGRRSSWNLRDSHMTDTLEGLREKVPAPHPPAKIVVWEHNSHIGDARATEMGRGREHNVGQLARERWGDDVYLIGFTTFEGSVTAADDWDRPARRHIVRPGIEGSYERLFHEVGAQAFALLCGDRRGLLDEPRLERAIGVVYRPQTERASHYFLADMARQFDAVLHIDRTEALEPLERSFEWDERMPETFPSGV